MLPLTPELVLAPNIFLALLSIDVMVRALSSARRSSREQTSNAQVTFSQRRPFPKLHALVLPSSLSTLPPFFRIVAPASFLPSAKKGGNCTDVILGAIIIGGIIIAVQARRTSASIGVMNLLAPSGTRQCQSGDVFSDHHDFGSDPR